MIKLGIRERRMKLWMATTILLAGCVAGSDGGVSRGDYADAVVKIERFIEHEMADKGLPGLSIVLVDDQDVVWAAGFGVADSAASTPASAATVYRIGSVSKLFTDIGVMQLVEAGALDLDAPITDYVPEFSPANQWQRSVTLRQVMAHRSGLVREPPIGHYFDASSPSLAATVASLNGTSLVYEPETRIKYSNAAIATVGYVLERVSGEPFADFLQRSVLGPLGMEQSAFVPNAGVRAQLATAYMWSYHGRNFEAPGFQLGMSPAGSMYAPVTDLAKFLSAVFAGGQGEAGAVLSEASLNEMLTPQFAQPGETDGYGLGFRLGDLDGRRFVGHGGAIYGFATQLGALPDERLGAAAVTTVDGANAVVDRIVSYALRSMLAARSGVDLPAPVTTVSVPSNVAEQLAGRYGDAGGEVRIEMRNESTYAWFGDLRVRVRAIGDTLVADDRLAFGTRMTMNGDELVIGGRRLQRLEDPLPEFANTDWLPLIGEYGWDFNTLYVYEQRGQLRALIEWFFDYPLTQEGPNRFAFPDRGLYHGEELVFERNGADVPAVLAAGIRFPRRVTAGDETFTIQPVRSIEDLRREALVADPPNETANLESPDLVELRELDSSIRYDIRYATTNNFMQSVFYETPHAYMQRPAAEALVRAHRALEQYGFGLLIHDAYRPWYVTKMFWDATPDSQKIFVANPASGSRHNRGAAVDLTLYELQSGDAVRMVGGYDEFSDRSFPGYVGGTTRQRWLRELLRRVMEAEGFEVYEYEWWHFDFGNWSRYPISNLRFDEIADLHGRP